MTAAGRLRVGDGVRAGGGHRRRRLHQHQHGVRPARAVRPLLRRMLDVPDRPAVVPASPRLAPSWSASTGCPRGLNTNLRWWPVLGGEVRIVVRKGMLLAAAPSPVKPLRKGIPLHAVDPTTRCGWRRARRLGDPGGVRARRATATSVARARGLDARRPAAVAPPLAAAEPAAWDARGRGRRRGDGRRGGMEAPAMSAIVWHDVECGGYTADLPLWRELADRRGGPGARRRRRRGPRGARPRPRRPRRHRARPRPRAARGAARARRARGARGPHRAGRRRRLRARRPAVRPHPGADADDPAAARARRARRVPRLRARAPRRRRPGGARGGRGARAVRGRRRRTRCRPTPASARAGATARSRSRSGAAATASCSSAFAC